MAFDSNTLVCVSSFQTVGESVIKPQILYVGKQCGIKKEVHSSPGPGFSSWELCDLGQNP